MTVAMQIPPLPAAHAQALALLLQHDVGLAEVAAIIESDPGLTAATLRGANSADSAPVARIVRAGDAIVRLGARTSRALIVAAMLRNQMDRMEGSRLDMDELWRHVIGVGIIADGAMSAKPGETAASAFTGGVLHDLGRVVLAAGQPRHYAKVVRLVHEGADPLEAERRVLGLDHAQFGAEVAEVWAVPPDLAIAITEHHEDPRTPLARHLQTGRRIAARLSIGDGLCGPDDPRLCAEPAEGDDLLIASLGGPDRLKRRVDWFRGALG